MKGKLKQSDIDTLAVGYHHVGGGLYLWVSGPNARSWLYRYKLHNKARWHGLGGAKDVSLAAARKLRDKCRAEVRGKGIDVVGQRQQQREADRKVTVTFRQAAEAFIAGQEHHWKSVEEGKAWRASLATYAFPILGDKLVADITRQDVLKVLEPIWLAKAETAKRLRGRIENILNWSVARGDRPEDVANAADLKMIKHGLPKQARKNGDNHHPSLPYKDIRAFMKELRQRDGVSPLALEFAILTAARVSEVVEARWSEIDRAEQTWTIPATRMKAGREHRVPLTPAALDVLDRAAKEDQGEFIFSRNGRHIERNAVLKVITRMGRDNATTHGFRSTFKDWARETTEFDDKLSEAAIAHKTGDKTYEAYARGTLFGRRRALMQAWSEYCGKAEG